MNRVLLVFSTIGLLSCSANGGDSSEPVANAGHAGGYVECVVPRREICAKEYRPTCGLRDTGIRCVTEPCDSWEMRSYGNACEACADTAVYGWRPGACEAEAAPDE